MHGADIQNLSRCSVKRIGIFGGTFDPPHNGHIKIAERAMKQFHLKKVYFVPVYIPPHKRLLSSTTAQQRLKMVRLAIEGRKGLKISDIELKQQGISYSVLTLKAFKRRFPHAEFVLIIGADNLAQFYAWKSPKTILRLASLAVYRRKGFSRSLQNQRIAFDTIKGQLFHVSSTEIRKRVEKGLSISTRVPYQVRKYIKRKSLYLNLSTIGRKRNTHENNCAH
jgi:nicotinate-nucleotide adenylyltransferase